VNWTKANLHLEVAPRTMSTRCLTKLGLGYRRSKPKRRTLGAYRNEVIRDYLISLDSYVKRINAGEKLLLVYLDESYLHSTHGSAFSYHEQGNTHKNKSSLKGRQIIILHVITDKGPLCELDGLGVPVDDIKWTKDTPHPQNTGDDEGRLLPVKPCG
jgi:hypothetical protein